MFLKEVKYLRLVEIFMYPSRFTHRAYRALLLGILVISFSWSHVSAQQGVLDLDGNSVNPLSVAGSKVVVLVFLRRDCPVSGRYAPTIQRLSKQYEHDAIFSLIYPDKADTSQEIRKYLAAYNYQLSALRDPLHELVKLAHVQITPEVAVFDRHRQLVYDGRIDNWYVDLNHSRSTPTTHELEDAIQYALDSKPIAAHELRGVGCYISDLE
jgi:hypothetical protein